MIEGFDASGWSGDIDFKGAYNSGKRYFIGRVGRGIPDGATDSNGIDLKWGRNKANSMAAGLFTGGYWRFFPSIDTIVQINKFTSALGLSNGHLDPWVDIEDHGGLSPKALTDWAIWVLNLVEEKTKRRPVLYTGKDFYDTRLEYWRLDRWKSCIAWQTSGKWREYGAHFWQYLLDTSVSWSTGRVDLQKFAFNDLRLETFQNELVYQFDEDGMLHGPSVYSDKLLPESGSQGTQTNDVAIVHTMVGYLNGTDASFRNPNNGLESHMGVGGPYDGEQLDGAIYQWMRVWEIADANYMANPYAFSIETSDGTKYLERWSNKQAESIYQMLAAWCLVYNRPARLVNRSHRSVQGIGHHRIGTVPNPRPGDDYWSNPQLGYRACPGDTRINQLTNEGIPRVRAILDSINTTPVDNEDDMALDDIVNYDNNGNAFTVRDALTHSYLTSYKLDILSEMADLIERVPEEIKEYVKSKTNQLTDLILVLNGQTKWNNLQDKTWQDLSSGTWVMNKSN